MIETTERYLKMINIVVQSRLTSCNKQRRDTSTNSFLFIFLFVGSVGGVVKCPPKHVQRKPNNAMREFFFWKKNSFLTIFFFLSWQNFNHLRTGKKIKKNLNFIWHIFEQEATNDCFVWSLMKTSVLFSLALVSWFVLIQLIDDKEVSLSYSSYGLKNF